MSEPEITQEAARAMLAALKEMAGRYGQAAYLMGSVGYENAAAQMMGWQEDAHRVIAIAAGRAP